MSGHKQMRRAQRIQSAQSWLQTCDGEQKKIVKAYRKRYGVDWPTAFRELEMLGVEIDAAYKEQVLRAVQEQSDNKRRKKNKKEGPLLLYDQDDDFAMIIGYTSGGAPYGVTWDEWAESDNMKDVPLPDKHGKKKSDIPYDELDANIVSLVHALNHYPGVITIGSCGGHEHPANPAQWEAGTWYVKFDIVPGKLGWYVLEHLAWAINEDVRLLDGDNVVLLPVSPPPYLNTPGQCLHFVIEGREGANPDELAKSLDEVRHHLTKKR